MSSPLYPGGPLLSRCVRCITLSLEAEEVIRALVRAAQTDYEVARRLKFVSRQPVQRTLTKAEILRLSTILGKTFKSSQAVKRAVHDPFIDPVRTSAAIDELSEIYRTAPRINASRVIEALILQASGDLNLEDRSVRTAPASHDDQAVYQSPDRSPRKTNAAARLHRGAGNSRQRVA